MKYKPKKIDGKFIWQCAYPDAMGEHILHSFVWDCLWGWENKDSSSIFKYYKTEKDALVALKNAILIIKQGLENYNE